MRFLSITSFIVTALSATMALAQPAAPAPAPEGRAAAPANARYSTASSQLLTLLANPAAKAVLVKHIPQLVEKEDVVERAGGMTLKEIQDATKNYAPDMLSDKVLAEIDTDLALIP